MSEYVQTLLQQAYTEASNSIKPINTIQKPAISPPKTPKIKSLKLEYLEKVDLSSLNSYRSNSYRFNPKKEPKYPKSLDFPAVKQALILEALKLGCSKKAAILQVEKNLKEAKRDSAVLKGLIQFLNW